MHKSHHKFAKPKRDALNPTSPVAEHSAFIPMPPAPAGDLTLQLETVLPGITEDITNAGKLVFHAVGDTGGIHGTETQETLAAGMQRQIDEASADDRPRFLYHLGDVVYFNGQPEGYTTQFYEVYQHLDYPIFAIPGNHDCGGDPKLWDKDGRNDGTQHPLKGFLDNFCSRRPHHLFKHRTTMTQPHCYWELETEFGIILGLNSNVDGLLDPPGAAQVQQEWASRHSGHPDSSIVAVHHAPYSLDSNHGGYGAIAEAIDGMVIWPDLVLSGHVHNYQRFRRVWKLGHETHFIVAGAGGYANNARAMHRIGKHNGSKIMPGTETAIKGLTLVNYNDTDPGWLRVTLRPTSPKILVEYFIIPFGEEKEILADSVEIK